MKKLWLGLVIGAAIAFLLDPRSGRRRRKVGADWSRARVRRAGRAIARTGRGVRAEAYGVSQKVHHLKEEEKPQPDDVTLAHKVESEIFRDAKVPKGQINVNAENGVVYLRGEAPDADMIRDLVEKTRKVQGVQDVANLLHLPGLPAPMHQ
jgi:osmotically-inducible protein OsmY